jgi:hypothetical protein
MLQSATRSERSAPIEPIIDARLHHVDILANDFGEASKMVVKFETSPPETHKVVLNESRPIGAQGIKLEGTTFGIKLIGSVAVFGSL